MGSEDTADHTISSTKATFRRVQYAFLTNRKFAFLISFLLAVITYTPIYISQNNNNNNKLNRNIRYGVGGSSASDELTSALNRKTYGRAAVAIIRVVGLKSEHGIKAIPNNNEVQYLVQIKSHDYPIEAFRGAVCLVGGNVNVADNNTKKKKNKMLKGAAIEEVDYDVTPLDTLKRELNEELLHPTWVDSFQEKDVVDDSNLFTLGDDPMFSTTSLVADSNENEDNNDNNDDDDPRQPGTIRYLGTTLHSHTSQLLQTPDPYAFYCALYEITIGINQLPHGILHQVGANVQEGRLALLSQDQLLQHASFAWGYEYTMERYFGKTSRNKQVGASVSEVDEKLWDTTSWNPGK